jgi:hypothetical protein
MKVFFLLFPPQKFLLFFPFFFLFFFFSFSSFFLFFIFPKFRPRKRNPDVTSYTVIYRYFGVVGTGDEVVGEIPDYFQKAENLHGKFCICSSTEKPGCVVTEGTRKSRSSKENPDVSSRKEPG